MLRIHGWVRAVICCCFYCVLVVVTMLALISQDQVTVTSGWDKSNHAIAFFVLLALFDYGYPSMKLWRRKVLWLLLYGLLIECAQAYVPSREASLLDIMADGVGLGLYIMIRRLLPWRVFRVSVNQRP